MSASKDSTIAEGVLNQETDVRYIVSNEVETKMIDETLIIIQNLEKNQYLNIVNQRNETIKLNGEIFLRSVLIML